MWPEVVRLGKGRAPYIFLAADAAGRLLTVSRKSDLVMREHLHSMPYDMETVLRPHPPIITSLSGARGDVLSHPEIH